MGIGAALPIGDHHDVSELRGLARREKNGRVASRMVAIANALDGMTRLAAARSARMDRQTLRDWVIRYNEDGIAGLHDQPKGHTPKKLSESEQAVLLAKVFQTPDLTRDGICAWTLSDLCDFAETRFGKRLSTSGVWGVLQRLGLSHQKARSVHPKSDPKAQAGFQKKGQLEAPNAAVDAHPDKTIRLYFQERGRNVAPGEPRQRNEPRVGQKGRLCHRWWQKGQRPPGRCDKRFKWAYIFGAVAPETGEAFGLILPRADTPTMSAFLAEFAKTLPENEHAVMVLD